MGRAVRASLWPCRAPTLAAAPGSCNTSSSGPNQAARHRPGPERLCGAPTGTIGTKLHTTQEGGGCARSHLEEVLILPRACHGLRSEHSEPHLGSEEPRVLPGDPTSARGHFPCHIWEAGPTARSGQGPGTPLHTCSTQCKPLGPKVDSVEWRVPPHTCMHFGAQRREQGCLQRQCRKVAQARPGHPMTPWLPGGPAGSQWKPLTASA